MNDDRTDPLTGVWSKQAWPALVAGAPAGAPVALLDLDRMKHFNMHNGYATGDAALARLGAYLAADASADRDVVRVGGQTFAIVWRSSPGVVQRARTSCGALLAWVRTSLAPSQPHECGDAHCLGPAALTATIALTNVRPDEDAAALLGRLDVGVQRAKRTGRDRILEV